MEITIKNMVCDRCIAAVQHVFEELQIPYTQVKLGLVETYESISPTKIELLDQQLLSAGFERVVENGTVLAEQIKATIIQVIQQQDLSNFNENWSVYIANELQKEYAELSSSFNKATGTTIEQYIIAQKIEKAKELLALNKLTAAEIAFNLGYSSAAHFSNQFKKITGQTPKSFSKSPTRFDLRNTLDKIV